MLSLKKSWESDYFYLPFNTYTVKQQISNIWLTQGFLKNYGIK